MVETKGFPKVGSAITAATTAVAMAEPARLPELGQKIAHEIGRRFVSSPLARPSIVPGLIRWGGVWGVALSLQGDSVPQYLRDLEGDQRLLERRIQTVEQELEDLLSFPAHTVITDPAKAAEISKRISEKTQLLTILNAMQELLALKIEKQTLLLNSGSDVEMSIINAKIHHLEMVLTEAIQSEPSTHKKSIGIMASAGSGSDAPPPADGSKKADGKTQDDPAEPVVEIASFVVNEWGVEIRLNIRDGELSADAINTIDVFNRVFPEKEGVAHFSFQVTDTLPEQIADWGFAFMDRSYQIAEQLKLKLSLVNVALKQGGALSPAYQSILKDVDDAVNSLMDEFKKEQATLGWVAKHLGGDVHGEALRKAIGVALHDSQNSVNKVQEVMIPAMYLQMGRPVDDAKLQPSSNMSQSSLYGVVRAGLAQVTVELEQEQVVASVDDPIFAQVAFQLSPKQTKRVMLIFQNLIGNGGRYSDDLKEAKTVAASAHLLTDGSLEVTVTDNGIGLPASSLYHIGAFEYQTGQKAVAGSSGKGVHSVIQTLKELGWGPLQVKSVQGEGTSFRFVIPPQAFKVTSEMTSPVVPRTATDIASGFVIPDAAKPHLPD